MNLSKIYMEEDLFPKQITNYEKRDYGYLFYNEKNKDSYDSNHALIYKNKVKDLPKVLEDIIAFYKAKGINPSIYQSILDEGYFKDAQKQLSDLGFESWEEEQKYMILSAQNVIITNPEVTVQKVSVWKDIYATEIFEAAGEPWEIEVAKRALQNSNTLFFVAFYKEKPVGMTYAHVTDGVCRVNYLLVSKQHRNIGVGRALISCFVKYCKENNIENCFLWPDGETAEKIYQEAGFRFVETKQAGRATYKLEKKSMFKEVESVQQAKASFDRILDNQKYAGIIRDDKHLALLMSLVDGGNYQRILDIGTGTGYLAFPLAEKFSEAKVFGIDIAETIIKKNNEVVKEKEISNLIFQAFDGLIYPFEEGTVDLIVTRYAFHHFPNVLDAICQMNKILAKGGKVLISDPMRSDSDTKGVIDDFMRVKKDGHIQFYSLSELEKLFVENGFIKEKQIISEMRFPFAPTQEYIDVFNETPEEERKIYNISNGKGVVWVNHIDVGNTVFVKD